ncbi:hypothetical protein [Aestuariivirga sp.]|uniref:hypothetical protein n=1 Tax=Aestuariivirga sp. TaxID=2650926 RepID=UPI003593C362
MIIVYLDTSDYARLYRTDAEESIRRIYDFLIGLVEERKICIPISYLTLFELLQDYSPEYLSDRRLRAKCLSKLSRSYGVPFLSDLLEGDRSVIVGGWAPKEVDKEFSVKILVAQIRERIVREAPLPRAVRRRLGNSSQFRRVIKENPEHLFMKKGDLNGLPVPDTFIEGQYLRRYLLGEIGSEVADRELKKIITDPVSFFEFWFEWYNRPNPLTTILQKPAATMKAQLDLARDRLAELEREAAKMRVTRKELKSAIQRVRTLERETGIPSMLKNYDVPPVPEVSSIMDDQRLEQCLISLPTEIRPYAKIYLLGLLRGRSFQNSDLGDLIHATYLPVCDLWRGDRTFSNLLMANRAPHHDRIVGSLAELPARISRLLDGSFTMQV